MSKYSRLGKNTLLVFVGNAGAKLIGLLMLPLYTRWLSVEDYGTTDIIMVYKTLLLGIVTCCMASAVFIFPKGQSVDKQKEYFSSGIAFSVITLTVTALLFYILNHYFTTYKVVNSFSTNIWLIYGMIVSSYAQQYVQQFTRSIDKIKVYSITGIVLTAGIAITSFLLIPYWGVKGYVFANIIANVLAALYSLMFSQSYKLISLKSIKKYPCWEMLRYSIPLIPNAIMGWLISALNRPLMEGYLDMHSIGIFAVANKFPGVLSMLFTIFVTSWQISVIEEFKKKDFNVFFNRIFRLVIVGLVFLFFFITMFSQFIVTIFAAHKFFEAWKYVPMLTLSVVFYSVSSLAGSVFSASRESKFFFYSSLWGAIVAIVANFLLIPSLGVMGAAISVLLSFMAMSASRIKYAWKYIEIKNVKVYLIMFSIAILTIAISLNIQLDWLRYFLFAILLLVLILFNSDLKKDLLFIYDSILARFK